MNKRPLITVVVPVYNVQDYLQACVNSIINQRYKNLEIILVDDGSTDSSGRLCDEYSEMDKRIIVIHQNNAGLSGARNAAIEIAKGDYITFVDSDDTINDDMISSLYELMIKNDAELAVTGLRSFWEDGTTKSNSHGNKVIIYNKCEALDCFLFNDYLTPCVCGKLYKMSLWQDIRCPLGKLHEDQFTTYKLIDKCSVVVFATDAKYNYRKRNGSIGHSSFSERTYDLYIGINEEYNYISSKYGKSCPNVDVEKITWELVFVNLMICAGKKDELLIKKTRKFARKSITKVLKCGYINITRKLQIVLFGFSYPLYVVFYKWYKNKYPMA